MIHMECEALFSLKNMNEKIQIVICCTVFSTLGLKAADIL